MNIDLQDNAKTVLRSFIQTLEEEITHTSFDVILTAGNSGAVMNELTRLVYAETGIRAPSQLSVPLYQHSNTTDAILRTQETHISKTCTGAVEEPVDRVLFVDDEIGEGGTLASALRILLEITESAPSECTVIAEDDGFHASNIEDAPVEFRPFSNHKEDVYNAVFWCVPREYQEPVRTPLQERYGPEFDDKWVLSILLDAPVKGLDDGMPIFHREPHKVVSDSINLTKLQGDLQEYMKGIIQEASVKP